MAKPRYPIVLPHKKLNLVWASMEGIDRIMWYQELFDERLDLRVVLRDGKRIEVGRFGKVW